MNSINELELKEEEYDDRSGKVSFIDKSISCSNDKKNPPIKEEKKEDIFVKEEPLFYAEKDNEADSIDIKDDDNTCKQELRISSTQEVTNKPLFEEVLVVPDDCKKENLEQLYNDTSSKALKCSQCLYSTDIDRNLKRHVKKHLNIKQFKCSQCNFATNYKFSLNRHVLKHSDIKRFKCSHCEYTCKERCALNNHMLKHSDFKRFKCSQCDYANNQKRNLKRHVLHIHSLIKKFKCFQCNFATKYKARLNTHKYSHIRVKFRCSQCDYTSNQKRHLKRHIFHKHLDT